MRGCAQRKKPFRTVMCVFYRLQRPYKGFIDIHPPPFKKLHLVTGDGATLGAKLCLNVSSLPLCCDTSSSISRFTGDPAASFVVKLAKGGLGRGGVLKATAARVSLSHGKIERGR